MIVNCPTELIGNTPLMVLSTRSSMPNLLLKLEMNNPCGSMKDRMARNMVAAAERTGALRPGGTIVESSSGNTATALAMIAAERGYQFVAVVDNHMTIQKRNHITAFGGKVVNVSSDSDDESLLTSDRDHTAELIASKIKGAVWTCQHDNKANAESYEQTLAHELIAQVKPRIDVIVGAVGTGGSLCGTTRRLRKTYPNVLSIGVEPTGSIIFGGPASDYYQSGTGTPEGAKVGDVVDYAQIDVGEKVTDQQAFNTARYLAREYGVLLGGSAGGVVYQAIQYAKRARTLANIVVIVPDGGEKYLDTIYSDQWMGVRDLLCDDVCSELDFYLAPPKRGLGLIEETLPAIA